MGIVTVKAISGSVTLGNKKIKGSELSIADGVDCQDNFSDYADEPLKSKISGGYMQFDYSDGKLYTITTYSTNETLTDEELTELGEYTQGQWSDGIGEGFEQFPCDTIDGEELYISPWYYGQVLKITQED